MNGMVDRGSEAMDTLYIVMPAYNEEGIIESVIRQWYGIIEKMNSDSKLVVASAGSTDSTDDIIDRLRNEMPQLEVIRDTDRYHGPKVIALYDYAIKNGADYVFHTDSDGQTDPEEFEMFWELRSSYDGVFGKRVKRGDGTSRALVERVVCVLVKLYFGVSVPDANAPFRLMKCDILKKYLYRLPGDYNIPNIMLTAYFEYYKEKTTFREISFGARTTGVNSINIGRIIKIGCKALKDFSGFKRDMVR